MSQIPNYFARQPVSRLSPTTTPTTKQQGRLGDAVDAFQAGGLSAVGGIFDFVGADGIAKQFYGWSDSQQETMSDRGKTAMGKSFFDENEQGETVIGEGLTDIDTWLLTLANVAGQFVPTAIPGAGAAGLATRVAGLGAKGKAAATAVSMGATGGAAATGQGMEQAREEARNIPDALKAESPLFRDVFRGIHQNNPGWTDEQKWDAATEVIANKVADEVRSDPKVLLANFGAAAIGDPIIGRALMGARLAKSGALRSAAKGFVVEGSTEAAQAGVSQYGINQALQPVDNRDAMKGVTTAALNEGIAGGGFGAGAGLLGGLINRNQPEQATPAADPVADAIRDTNPELAGAFDSLNETMASSQAAIDEIINYDQPTAARKAGFNTGVGAGQFGDMLTSPVQQSLDQLRARTVADLVSAAAQFNTPTPQDRFSPVPFQYEGELLSQGRQSTAGALPGATIPGEQARFIPDNRLDGEYQQPIRTTPRPQGIADKGIIFGNDNRPEQQAQERANNMQRQAQQFADDARRNAQPRIHQKDIIFADNQSGVTVKQSGKPFQSPKEALASKGARDAKRAGAQIEAVPFADGYGWRVVDRNISQATGANVGTTNSDQAAVTQSPETDTAPSNAQEAQARPAIEPVADADATAAQQDATPPDNAEPAADLAGETIDPEWTAFADDTGTKKIPRSEMPQIKAEHRGAMVQFMKGRDITHEQDTVPAVDLKPTQAEFSPAKVKKAMDFEGGNRSILVSSDGYVLDGHHQWLAAREKGEQVDVIRLNAPIEELIPLAKEFPSSTVADGATEADPDSPASKQPQADEQTPADAGVSVSEPEQIESAEQSSPIEDFGEKIGGARKDVWGGFSDAINSDATTTELPLSKSFPEPDYVKMAADGVPMETLALIAAMRAEIPTKPRDAYKVRRWAEKVDTLRGFTADLINGDVPLEDVIGNMRKGGGDLAAIADAIPAIAKANPETLKLAAKYRLGSGAFSIFRGNEYKPNKVFYFPKNGRTEMLDLASDSKQAALDNLSALIEAEANANKDTPGTKQSKIDVYQNRYTKQVYLGWKGGSGVLKIQDFPSVNAARDYLKSNRAEVEAKLGRIKETPGMRRPENRDRVGPPRFAGNVTPAIFADTFGFRGVEFGNWVEQGRRQKDLNEAYDALMDLAEVLGIPPKALALNGELGMAFGARGKGGKRSAKAHYEGDYVAINMTKDKGAGSLAHEWWHAVDHYFARMVGKPASFATDGSGVRGSDMRPEVRSAFDGVMSAIRKSGLIQRSAKLDERRSKPYWSTTQEASARSFEAFIIAELEAKGFSNDYLANIIEPEAWNALEEMRGNLPDQTYPYPTKAEQAGINPAYRTLFDTLQTKETDKGVMLYSRQSVNPQTETEAFKQWFGDSKVVDADGRPKVMYHGTAADFSEFSKRKATDKEGRKLGFGWGKDKFYFADNGEAASSSAEFAQMTGRGDQPNVMPVYLKMEKPMLAADYMDMVRAQMDSGKSRDQAIAATDKSIVKQGYDGIFDPDTGGYAVFEANQIKSATGNNGDFDPDNADVSFAAGNYSTKRNQRAKGVPSGQIEMMAKLFMKKLNNAAGIKVVVLRNQKEAELAFNQSLSNNIVRGAYNDKTKTAYLIAENFDDIQHARRTLAHEVIAHGGLQSVIGAKAYSDFLTRINTTRTRASFRPAWNGIMNDYGDLTPEKQAEEFFARWVEDQPETGSLKYWWQALVRWLNKQLAKVGVTRAENNDVAAMRDMLDSIVQGFKSGRAPRRQVGKAVAFDKADVGLTESKGSAKLAMSDETLSKLRDRYGETGLEQWWENEFGYGFDKFTESEGRYILNAKDADKIRDRVSSARQSASAQSSQENTGSDEPATDLDFSRTATEDTRSAKEKLGLGEQADETLKEKATARYRETADTLKSTKFWQRLNEGIFDGMAGIKQAEESVGVTDPNQQGYVSARLASGLADVLHGVFHYGAPEWRNGVVARKADTKGLLEVFSSLGDDLNNWLAWMGANRAEKLMAEGRENNLTADDIAELKALADGKEQQFESVRQEYNKINSAIIDLAQQAGLISEAQRSGFDEEWYVPFFRDMDVDPEMQGIAAMVHGPKSKQGIANQNAQLKELKGGKQSTKDLLENIIQRQSTLIDAALKNHAMLEIVGNLSGTDYMQPVTSPEIAALSQTELNLLSKVKVMRDGKPEAYAVSDPALLRGLLQINDAGSKSLFNRLGRSAKRFLTAGITLSPDFIVKNFVRDAAHAWMVNKDDFKFGADSIKGLRKAFKEDEAYRDLIFSGAAFQGGYIHGADPEAATQQVRRALKAKGLTVNEVNSYMDSLVTKGGQLLEKYRNASDKVENANRLMTYEAALAAGKSAREAAFSAKDLMDYSLKGNFALIGSMIDFLPFFNARLQGLSKLVRAAKAGDGDRVLKVLSANLAMKGMKVAAFSLALAAMNYDDERYQELADWDKDSNWHFWLGDEHIRIPKPFELGIVFGTFPERMLHYGTGTQPASDLGKAVSHAVFNTLALNPIPQLALPAVEVMVNRSFFKDSSIEGMADENRQPGDRYNAYTSEVAKQLGQLFNVSPKKIEHLVKGYTGTIGGYVLGASDIVAKQMLGIESADTPISRYPVVKAFYQGDAPKTNTKFQQEFYDALDAAGQAYGSYKKAAEEGDTERQQKILEANKEKLGARIQLNRLQRQLSELNKQAERVNNNSSLTGAQKREQLDSITRRKNAIYHAGYVRFNLGEW